MIVSIHQPSFLPWLGYFHRIALSDLHILLDTVQLEKNSFINRNKIRISKGWMWLTVPLLTKGKFGNLAIREVEVNNRVSWRQKHQAALKSNYGRAKFWDSYKDSLLTLYQQYWSFLAQVNIAYTRWALQMLGIPTEVRLASEFYSDKRKGELVLDLCRKAGATSYISGKLGKNYLNEEAFRQSGIRVVYQDYRHPVYPQRSEPFEPNMCVIDILMNCGNESLSILMAGQGRKELGLT